MRLELETQLPPSRKEASSTWSPKELHTQEMSGGRSRGGGFLGWKEEGEKGELANPLKVNSIHSMEHLMNIPSV